MKTGPKKRNASFVRLWILYLFLFKGHKKGVGCMSQIEESDFRDTIIAIKKDAKLVAAAKNDRTNSMETLYREFEKLTVERRRELLIAISNDYFTAAQWKIAFPLNNLPAPI